MKRKAYLDPAIREGILPMLRIVLAILRAQYLSYQTSHWQARGPAYYGNHLLFQRLYEGVQAEIDALGEKLVGYFGIEAVDLEISLDLVCEMVSRWCSHECHFNRGLASEGELQNALVIIRNGWPEGHYPLPLGLDDWLAATANAHESNQYLIQQVLGASASEWPAVMGRNAALQLQKVSVPLATTMNGKFLGVTPTFIDGLAYGSLVIHKSNRGGWVLSFSPEQSDGTRAPALAIQSAKTRKNAEIFLEAIVNVVPAVARAQSKSDAIRYKDEISEAISTVNTSLPQSSIPVSDKRDQVRQWIKGVGLMSLGDRYGKAGEFFGPKGGSRVISLGKRDVLLNTYQVTNYGDRFGESWVLVKSELISKITPDLIEKWARWVKQGPTMIEVRNDARDGGEGSRRRASGAPSAEGHFYGNPRKGETREFAESGAPTNVPDVGKAFVKEHGNEKVMRQVHKTPPTPEEIIEEQPGSSGASTLSRLVVKSEEPDIASAAKANRARMASWLRGITSRR